MLAVLLSGKCLPNHVHKVWGGAVFINMVHHGVYVYRMTVVGGEGRHLQGGRAASTLSESASCAWGERDCSTARISSTCHACTRQTRGDWHARRGPTTDLSSLCWWILPSVSPENTACHQSENSDTMSPPRCVNDPDKA